MVNNVNEPAFIYKNNSKKNNYLRLKLVNENNKPIFGSKVSIYNGNEIQLFESSNVRGIYSTSENIIHFGLSDHKKVDSLIVTWPNFKQTKLFDVKANQLLKINSNNSKNYNSKSSSKKLFFEEITTKIKYTHIENSFDDYKKQVL